MASTPACDSLEEAAFSEPETSRAVHPSILVVDDRPENIELIQAILSGLDVNLLLATCGPEALEISREHELAAALVDVCMPGMDGFELALAMRTRENTLPVILVTALDRRIESVRRAYSIGCTDLLYKPVEPVVLRAKVQVFLDLFRLRHAEKSRVLEMEALHESLDRRRAQAERMAAELASQKTELEHRNGELTLRNLQLDSFTHVVSHDLRQPLGSILDYLELIESAGGERLDAHSSRWIRSSLKLGRNMQGLIDSVLEYSRLGSVAPASGHVDTNITLASALESLHAAVKESGAVVSQGNLPPVIGSEGLITRLFENLIGNAIKYRRADPPKVHVSCTWHAEEEKWCFQIADNGRGFAPADAGKIFEMFARSTDACEIPGSGIGLAVCKRIAELHGGRIWAESEPGLGSSFFFLLPYAANGC